MREILFRGKVIESTVKEVGEWVYGHLVVRNVYDDEPEQCFICEEGHKFMRCLNKMPCTYKVDPETVGQFTGLKDKKGKRIFEGDLVMFRSYTEPCEIAWDQEEARWFMKFSDCFIYFDDRCIPMDFEVIGNIHDNPELIAEVENAAD